MTEDELLAACFPEIALADLQRGEFCLRDYDEASGDHYALLDVSYRLVTVWLDVSGHPGAGARPRTETIRVAYLANLCVDPAHRGQGHGKGLLAFAHAEASRHALIDYALLEAREDSLGFYLRQGYQVADLARPLWLVYCLRGDQVPWPQGRLDTSRL